MYINIESFNDLKKLQGGALESMKRNNCIIFIRMNGCHYCDQMKQEWHSLVKDKENDSNIDILEIERNRINDLVKRDREFFLPKFMGIRGFPTIMLQNRKRKLFPFQGDRSKANFLRFIKAHSKPLIMEKPAVNKPVNEPENTTKSHEGLRADGRLKKGYEYEKKGKIKKVKKVKKEKKDKKDKEKKEKKD